MLDVDVSSGTSTEGRDGCIGVFRRGSESGIVSVDVGSDIDDLRPDVGDEEGCGWEVGSGGDWAIMHKGC